MGCCFAEALEFLLIEERDKRGLGDVALTQFFVLPARRTGT